MWPFVDQTLCLEDCDALNANVMQRFFYLVQLEWLNYRLYFLHEFFHFSKDYGEYNKNYYYILSITFWLMQWGLL